MSFEKYHRFTAAGHTLQQRRVGLVVLKSGSSVAKPSAVLRRGSAAAGRTESPRKIQRLILLGHREHALFAKGRPALPWRCPPRPAGGLSWGRCSSASIAASWRGPGFGRRAAPCQREIARSSGQPILHHRAAVSTATRYWAPYGITTLTASNQVQKVRSFKNRTSSSRSGVSRASTGAASYRDFSFWVSASSGAPLPRAPPPSGAYCPGQRALTPCYRAELIV